MIYVIIDVAYTPFTKIFPQPGPCNHTQTCFKQTGLELNWRGEARPLSRFEIHKYEMNKSLCWSLPLKCSEHTAASFALEFDHHWFFLRPHTWTLWKSKQTVLNP